MRKTIMLAVLAVLTLSAGPTYAEGCLSGAAAGGLAGHFVGKGHGVIGAAIGCAVGHHRADKKNAQQQQAAQATPAPAPQK